MMMVKKALQSHDELYDHNYFLTANKKLVARTEREDRVIAEGTITSYRGKLIVWKCRKIEFEMLEMIMSSSHGHLVIP